MEVLKNHSFKIMLNAEYKLSIIIYDIISFHVGMLAENSVFIWVMYSLSMQLMHMGNMGCRSKSITNKANCKLINAFQLRMA